MGFKQSINPKPIVMIQTINEITETFDSLAGLKDLVRKAGSLFTAAPRLVSSAATGDLKNFQFASNQSLTKSFSQMITGNAIALTSAFGASKISDLANKIPSFLPDGSPAPTQPDQPYTPDNSPQQAGFNPLVAVGLVVLIGGGLLMSKKEQTTKTIT